MTPKYLYLCLESIETRNSRATDKYFVSSLFSGNLNIVNAIYFKSVSSPPLEYLESKAVRVFVSPSDIYFVSIDYKL